MKSTHASASRAVTIVFFCLLFSGYTVSGDEVIETTDKVSKSSHNVIESEKLRSVPIAFTRNSGQWNEQVLFRVSTGGVTTWLTDDGFCHVLTRRHASADDSHGNTHRSRHMAALGLPSMPDSVEYLKVKTSLLGANLNPTVVGLEELEYKCSYYLGNDKSKWQEGVPNYRSVIYEDVYPGIDMKYHGRERNLEYDFIIEPGADPSQIKLRFNGIKGLAYDESGNLMIETDWNVITQHASKTYQLVDGVRTEVSSSYVILDDSVVGFRISGSYDPNLPLTIDPVLSYSSYFGGTGDDWGGGVAVDDAGNIYLTGWTYSEDFPTESAHQGIKAGTVDIFISKLDPTGHSLIYSTYFGGTSQEYPNRMALKGDGGLPILWGLRSHSIFPLSTP
jgi:hypothetical protein